MKRFAILLTGFILLSAVQATAQEQARIRIYRTQTFIADQMRFEVSLNNSVTFQPAINTRAEFAVDPGKVKIAAKSKKNSSLTLQAEAGRVYYIRSNSVLKDGNIAIELLLMDGSEGEAEFSAITSEIITRSQSEPVQLNVAQNVLLAIDSERYRRSFELGILGGVGIRTGDIAYSYYLAEQPTPLSIDYGVSLFMRFREVWAVGVVSAMQTALTYNGPANFFFSGAGFSTRHLLGAEQDAWVEGGILLGWQHAGEKLPQQYGSTVMVPRSGNTIAPMGFVGYTRQLSSHLAFNTGIRLTISSYSHYSEINPDTQATEKKENYDYGLPPTLTIWCAELGLKYIL